MKDAISIVAEVVKRHTKMAEVVSKDMTLPKEVRDERVGKHVAVALAMKQLAIQMHHEVVRGKR